MITVTFACGHSQGVLETAASAPRCAVCQESQVRQTVARPPKFRGVATGPYAEYQANAAPAVVNVAPAGPLPLKG